MINKIEYSQQNLFDKSRRRLLKRVVFLMSGISIFPEFIYSENSSKNISTPNDIDVETFRSFIDIVIPGTEKYSKFLVEEFIDEFYGFSKYFELLVNVLNKKSNEKYNTVFSQLTLEMKKEIVRIGTESGIFKKQIFHGAIYLLQLVVFSGLCEEDQSCDIIDFPGVIQRDFQTYPEAKMNQLNSITLNGNPF